MVDQKIISLILLLLLLSACGGSSSKKRLNIPYVSESSRMGGVEETVPYKDYGGVRTIQVKLNDCSEFPMIFDTGCSGLSLSVIEVYALAKQGCLSGDDIDGYGYSTIADGSIVPNMIINLHTVQIGNLVCKNVKASVSDNEAAPLLLGNGVLDQVESFTTDNENKTITFHLK